MSVNTVRRSRSFTRHADNTVQSVYKTQRRIRTNSVSTASQYADHISRTFTPVRQLVRSASLRHLRGDLEERHVAPPAAAPVAQDEVFMRERQADHDRAYSDYDARRGVETVRRRYWPYMYTPDPHERDSSYQSHLSRSYYTPPTLEWRYHKADPFYYRVQTYAREMSSPLQHPPRSWAVPPYNLWHSDHIHTGWYPWSFPWRHERTMHCMGGLHRHLDPRLAHHTYRWCTTH